MKLYYSNASPYVRKVVVTGIEAGLDGEIERLTPAESVWIGSGDPQVADENPLGKIPTLIMRNGEALIDSTLICEYLASLAPDALLLPQSGTERWQVLQLQALAQGAMDAIMLRNVEMLFRPGSMQWDEYVARQTTKIDRTFNYLEKEISYEQAAYAIDSAINLGTITLACTLGYLAQRFDDQSWRDSRPALAKWFDIFSQRTSMQTTMPSPLPPAHLDPRQR